MLADRKLFLDGSLAKYQESSLRRHKLITHHVISGAHDEDDIVGRSVAVPLLESVDNSLSRNIIGQEHRVAHVRADMIAGALEA